MTERNDWSLSSDVVDLRRRTLLARPVQIPACPQRLTLDLARTALIVVDMQNDFCHPDGWLATIGVDVAPAAQLAPAIAELTAALRRVDVPVIWLNWGNRPDRANLPPGVRHIYDPDGAGTGIGEALPSGSLVLTKGSWSAELLSSLAVEPEDITVDKYRMSGFHDTELDSVLRNLRVDTLLFAGVNADQCVFATLIDAACVGYDVVMLTDVVGTTSPDYCLDATIYNVRQCFGFTAISHDLKTAIETLRPSEEPAD